MDSSARLAAQLGFLIESEKLKDVLRRSSPVGMSRRENSAEHSWTLALMAILLAEHANAPVNPGRVLGMLLLHDLVEIDAGDTFCYDAAGNETKAERERQAAERIFGLLPEDQAKGFRELWEEFEEGVSAEAAFANALDRLMPLIQNFHNDGRSWREHGVTHRQVLERNRGIGEGSAGLWKYAEELIEKAKEQGLFGGSR